MTRYQQIKNMSLDEMVELFSKVSETIVTGEFCDYCMEMNDCDGDCNHSNVKEHYTWWLSKEV